MGLESVPLFVSVYFGQLNFFFTVTPNSARAMIHVFLVKTTQNLASRYCQSLGAFIPSPSSQDQLELIYNTSSNHKICSKVYWTPIVKSEDNLKWETVDRLGIRTKAEFLPWSKEPSENCVIIDQKQKFQAEKCSVEHCFPCQFQEQVLMTFWVKFHY